MRKTLMLASLAIVVMLAACSKGGDGVAGLSNLPKNTWTVGTQTNKAILVEYINGYFEAVTDTSASNIEAITFRFYHLNYPSMNKTYKVVKTPSADDEVSFFISGSLGYYMSADNGTKADIKIVNGKVSIDLQKTNAVEGGGGSIMEVAANITQD